MKEWTTKAQQRYMKVVENSNRVEREFSKRLRSDAVLDQVLTSGQIFLIEDALGEAYRAGAIDALMEEK